MGPKKRLKTESGSSTTKTPTLHKAPAVLVEIGADDTSLGKAIKLRFMCPNPLHVTVAIEGSKDENKQLLDGLWPEPLGAMSLPESEPGSHVYDWVQVLAGLRESTLSAAPTLLMAAGVTASDVVLRVRARMAKKTHA